MVIWIRRSESVPTTASNYDKPCLLLPSQEVEFKLPISLVHEVCVKKQVYKAEKRLVHDGWDARWVYGSPHEGDKLYTAPSLSHKDMQTFVTTSCKELSSPPLDAQHSTLDVSDIFSTGDSKTMPQSIEYKLTDKVEFCQEPERIIEVKRTSTFPPEVIDLVSMEDTIENTLGEFERTLGQLADDFEDLPWAKGVRGPEAAEFAGLMADVKENAGATEEQGLTFRDFLPTNPERLAPAGHKEPKPKELGGQTIGAPHASGVPGIGRMGVAPWGWGKGPKWPSGQYDLGVLFVLGREGDSGVVPVWGPVQQKDPATLPSSAAQGALPPYSRIVQPNCSSSLSLAALELRNGSSVVHVVLAALVSFMLAIISVKKFSSFQKPIHESQKPLLHV